MQQQINLLQPPLTRQRTLLSLGQLAMVAAAVILVLAALSGVQYWQGQRLEQNLASLKQRHAALQKGVEAVQAQLAKRQADPELQAEVARVDRDLQHKQQVLQKIEQRHLGNQQGFAQVFVGLARQRIEGLWLTGLHLSQGGQALDLRGSALDPTLLPRYLQRLRQEPSLSGLEFETFLMKRPADNATHVDFDLQSKAAKSASNQDRG